MMLCERETVGFPPVDRTLYSPKGTLQVYIRKERRVEFALEGQRYNDLKRWRIAHTVLPLLKNPSGTPYVFEEHSYYLPFSIAERDNNPKLDQSDGY